MNKKSDILLKQFKGLIIIISVTGVVMALNVITFKSTLLNNICGLTVIFAITILIFTMIKTDEAWKREALEKIEADDKFLQAHYGGKVRCFKGRFTKAEKDRHPLFEGQITYPKMQIEGQLCEKNFKYSDVYVEKVHRSGTDKDDAMRYILFKGCLLQWSDNTLPDDIELLICTSGFYKRTSFKPNKRKYSLIYELPDESEVYICGKSDINKTALMKIYNHVMLQIKNILQGQEMCLFIKECTIDAFACDAGMESCEIQRKLRYIENVLTI